MGTYKASQYCISSEIDDKVILFNSLSAGLLEISKPSFQRYQQLAHDPPRLEREEPAFFKALVAARFMVPSDLDELEVIRFRNNRDNYINTNYELTINPTMNCNFGCWYCYETHVPGRMSDEVAARVIRHVQGLYRKRTISNLTLSWFGGEPMLCFDEVVVPVSRELARLSDEAGADFLNGITTNGYLLTERAIAQMAGIRMKFFQVTLDGNRAIHDASRTLKGGGSTYDRIVANITSLLEALPEAEFNLRINYRNQALGELQEIVDSFPRDLRGRMLVDFHRIWQTYKDEALLNHVLGELSEFLRDAGFKTRTQTLHAGRGDKCYADRFHQAVINHDGLVYKCTAKDFVPEHADGVLKENGEIEWDPVKLFKRFGTPAFENPTCLPCQLLPVCLGPCSQKALDFGLGCVEDFCPISTMQSGVEDYVRARYREFKEKGRICSCATP